MQPIHFTYLNRLDVERLALTDAEILAAVELALAAQGNRETVIEPRVHLIPKDSAEGHFNVLRGVIHPLGLAGVKVVGDFVNNYHRGLPSELAVLNLFDPETGAPKAILDATSITDMRTGAMTALGAKHLARKGSKVLAHIGARGTSYWNVRLLDHLFDFDEIRVHSRREESRNAFAQRLSRDLGKPVRVTEDWESCVRDADIVVEASRLPKPEPLLKTEWIQTRSTGHALWHDERRRALTDGYHEQDGRRRLGTVPQGSPVRRTQGSTLTATAFRKRRYMRSLARSWPAGSLAARTTTKRSCSGIAA